MQIKAGHTIYPFPTKPLTLGEQRLLKREFGFVPGAGGDLDFFDPDHVGAFIFWAMREQDEDAPAKSLLARINRLTSVDILSDDGKPLAEMSEEELEGADVEAPDPTTRTESTESEGETAGG